MKRFRVARKIWAIWRPLQFPSRFNRLCQGELLSLRLPGTPSSVTAADSGAGTEKIMARLLFDDGSQKGLAAFVVWCCLVSLQGEVSPTDLDDQGRTLVESLQSIPTMFKTKATLNRTENVIANIAKQDADSKAQPISSFLWSTILTSLNTSGVEVSYQEAIEKYNAHPDVKAYYPDGPAIDNKKTAAIKNWFESCGEGAKAIVQRSQHNIAFALGPFGETLSGYNFLFKGSKALTQADTTCGLTPLEGEASVDINWSLILGDEGQELLFEHIIERFEVETAVVSLEKKKKYRAQPDTLWPVRNACALFEQVKPFLQTKLSGDEVGAMKTQMASYSGCRDLQFILDQRPTSLAISMLPSKKNDARKSEEEKEQRKSLHLENKRVEVQASQWAFFKEALSSDQRKLSTVQKAPKKIKELKHLKEVEWLKKQEAQAKQAVQGYTDSFLRITDSPNTVGCVKETSDFVRQIALQPESKPFFEIR